MFNKQDQEERSMRFERIMDERILPLLEQVSKICEEEGFGYALSITSPPVEKEERDGIGDDTAHLHSVFVNAETRFHSDLIMAAAAVLSENWGNAIRYIAAARGETYEDMIDQLMIVEAIGRYMARRGLSDDDMANVTANAIESLFSSMIGGAMAGLPGIGVIEIDGDEKREIIQALVEAGKLPPGFAGVEAADVDPDDLPDISDVDFGDLYDDAFGDD